MPVACDPQQACIGKYEIAGWPTSILIDRDRKVVWRGSPYGVEEQIEQALGLESSPKTLLRLYFDACTGGDDEARRGAMERLVEKAPAAFDLRSFAETVLGAPAESAGETKPLKAKAALKLLAQLQKAWDDEARRGPALTRLALGASEPVDLAAWITAAYRKAYPFKGPELKTLLADKKYAAIVDMFVRRAPAGSLYKLAGKDDGLVAWCDKHSGDAWTFARKAKMGRMYWMSDEAPPEDFDSEGFSRDIAINGIMMDNERKRVMGIIIAGERVMKSGADAYAERQLARFYVMNAIAGGSALSAAKLDKKVAAELAKIVETLRAKYG